MCGWRLARAPVSTQECTMPKSKPTWELRIIARLWVDSRVGEERALKISSLRKGGLKTVSEEVLHRALQRLVKRGIIMLKHAHVWLLPDWWKRL
jgi:hypothetical protein